LYNEFVDAYNDGRAVPTSYVMTVSRNGQVSIPAAARARWATGHVLVVDLGDRVVIRPAAPVDELVGKYRDRGPSTDRARHSARSDDLARERRRR
jgi:bifunctional DNA-binding transcriptional regulator/antitoxin component of YhaV-PrlF toxin-antitoxin module